ncbi:MAG: hypothetical protein JXJ22_18170 [Bacteroidales bacterium]|nr:hypothetical protein [Bacteroidales bacterium]
MSIKKEMAIQSVSEDVEKAAEITLSQLNLFMEFILSGKIKLGEEILQKAKEDEHKLDKYEVKISDKVINTITLYHPMASDLRKLMACYRISDNLERIGDLIWDSLRYIEEINSQELYSRFTKLLTKMLTISVEMVKRSIIAFNYSDKESALSVINDEKSVDKLHRKLLEKLVKKTELNEKARQLLITFLNLRNIVSNIEQIADLATNIAEAAIYSFEGVDIRHKKNLPEM